LSSLETTTPYIANFDFLPFCIYRVTQARVLCLWETISADTFFAADSHCDIFASLGMGSFAGFTARASGDGEARREFSCILRTAGLIEVVTV